MSADGGYGDRDYSYDGVGNRLSLTVDGSVDSYSYDTASHRLLSISGAGAQSYGYDIKGNVISWGAYTFTYDPERNRLTGITGPGLTASYAYNAHEQRARSIVNGVETFFVYDDGGRLIAELDGSYQPIREYLWLAGEPLALVDDTTAPGIHYYHNDHLGTPQVLTDGGQQVTWEAEYTPFGRATVTTAGVVQPLRFPGQYEDGETGLHYNWHRHYEPESGRYLQSDPIGLDGGLGTYVYTSANPTGLIDPLGLSEAITSDWVGIDEGSVTPGPVTNAFIGTAMVFLPGVGFVEAWQVGGLNGGLLALSELPGLKQIKGFCKSAGRLSDVFWRETSNGVLTDFERNYLQEIANKYNVILDVVGSRAAGKGRNIE